MSQSALHFFYFNYNRTCNYYYRLKTSLWYSLFLKKCGIKNSIRKPIYITPSCIELHNNIFIRDHARIEGVFFYEGKKYDPCISLHNNVSIEQNLHLTCAVSITIGENSAIAANVTITDINHSYTDINLPPERQPITTQPVEIGPDCKLYNNVVILPGTKLGKHTVVSANAVVLGKTYPDFCVLAGAPAKIIKLYDSQKKEWVRTDINGNLSEA